MSAEMWMTVGVWATIIIAIFAAMRFLNGFVTKTACHEHGLQTFQKIDSLDTKFDSKFDEMNRTVGELVGEVRAQHKRHRQGE
jgi:hypothetical protein